jgi:hypothetical protein
MFDTCINFKYVYGTWELKFFSDWIKSLSQESTKSFLRGLELGVELEEAWLVCCATAYIWNYNNHVLSQLRHREVMDALMECFNGLKKVGHAGYVICIRFLMM